MTPESNGWVRAYRKTLDWPWFRDPKTAHFWEYCRLKATFQARRALVEPVSVDLHPGQFIFGRRVAADETGLSEQEIRTASKHLIREGCLILTNHSTNLFSIASICHWECYQSGNGESNQPSNQPLTNLQPTSNQPLTTDKNEKNEEECKEGKETDLPPDGGKKVSEKPKKPKAEPKPREPDLHADAFKAAFDKTFPDVGGYDWPQHDFVQLNSWRKKHPTITPDEFVAVAERHWLRGEFCPGAAKGIAGLCAKWSQLAAWQEGLPLNGTNSNRKSTQTGDIVPPSDFSHLATDKEFVPF